MSKVTSNKKITLKHTKPNPLFESWLKELYEEARATNSKLELILKEAYISLSKYPLPLKSGAECAIIKGFNKKICLFLDKRLEVYKELKIKCCIPVTRYSSNNNIPSVSPQCSSKETSSTRQNPQIRSPKICDSIYKPAFRSGGYALLLGLYDLFKDNRGNPVKKEELIEIAQKYSEESFVKPKPNTYYTAWSSMNKLIRRGLVINTRKKTSYYSLSEQGKLLAETLFKEIKHHQTTNDLIFNNVDLSTEHNENVNNTRSENDVREDCSVSSNAATCSTKSADDYNNVDLSNENVNDTRSENDVREDCSVSSNPATCSTKNSDDEINSRRKITLEPGSFDIVLLIDKNETSGLSKKNDPTVAQFNKFPNLIHEYRSLKVGDYLWIARHKTIKDHQLVLPYVVERKRMDDLGASIKDGRFHEQKFRLKRCDLENIIYLVENYGKNQHCGLPIQSLMQALANTRVQNGFKVHTTDSLTHTVRFLAMMTKRLTIEYKDKVLQGWSDEPKENLLMTFTYFNISSSKTRPLTVTDTFIKLLLQLKGMSVEKALAITNVYKTPTSLIEAYTNCDKKVGEMLLADLKFNNSRNIGLGVSKSIYQLFTILDESQNDAGSSV